MFAPCLELAGNKKYLSSFYLRDSKQQGAEAVPTIGEVYGTST